MWLGKALQCTPACLLWPSSLMYGPQQAVQGNPAELCFVSKTVYSQDISAFVPQHAIPVIALSDSCGQI